MSPGPVVIGFDGTPAAERAVRDAATLLAPRAVLVVVVWESGRAFELAGGPLVGLELPPAAVDVRVAAEVDRAMYQTAQELARHGAALAAEAGLQAETLVVADELTVADTLVRVAMERQAPAIVVGAHGHTALAELLFGSTTHGVLKRAHCPVIVVREEEPPGGE